MDYESTPRAQNEIVINDLMKKFGDVTAVDGLSLDIRKGELFGLLGPNGAGKTTTISMLCGLLEPSAGSAQIAGFDIGKEPQKTKERIGVCPQEAAVYQVSHRDGKPRTLWEPSRHGQKSPERTGCGSCRPGRLCRRRRAEDQRLQRWDDAAIELDDRLDQRPGDRVPG